MRVSELLSLPAFTGTSIVAGREGLDREVRWAHVIDMPGPAPWIGDGQLLLTTGYAWPTDARGERAQIEALAERHLAGIGLAVPGYVQHFSDAARALADGLALPLLEIPWDVPFARITEELHRALLASQQQSIARSEEIHRALTRAASEGTTLHDLARRLGELIERSVSIEDAAGKLLGHHTFGADDDTPSIVHELERRGHLEHIRMSSTPVRVPAVPELEIAARVVAPIRVGGAFAGFVWIIEGETALSDLDHRAAEHAALVAALQIAHQRELARLESRLGYASFLSLLEAPDTTPQTLERARLLGFDPDVTYRAGIAVLDEPLPLGRDGVLRRDGLLETLRRHLAAHGVETPMLGASIDRVPFLVPDGIALDAIADAVTDAGVRFVFGRSATGTAGVRASYREARELLGYDGLGRVSRFEDALVPRVLLGDARARAAFVRELFGALAGRKGEAALRDAMIRYADEGFAFRRTATALGIHPNTLRYRLERAATLTGLAFDDPDVRFRLQLAARLMRLSANRTDHAPKAERES